MSSLIARTLLQICVRKNAISLLSQRISNSNQIEQRQIVLASLDFTQIAAFHARQGRERLLGEAAALSNRTDDHAHANEVFIFVAF